MKKSELRKIIKEELLKDGFEEKNFKEDSNLHKTVDTLFNQLLNNTKKLTSNSDNQDLVLARIYNRIEGFLNSGNNSKYWKKY